MRSFRERHPRRDPPSTALARAHIEKSCRIGTRQAGMPHYLSGLETILHAPNVSTTKLGSDRALMIEALSPRARHPSPTPSRRLSCFQSRGQISPTRAVFARLSALAAAIMQSLFSVRPPRLLRFSPSFIPPFPLSKCVVGRKENKKERERERERER